MNKRFFCVWCMRCLHRLPAGSFHKSIVTESEHQSCNVPPNPMEGNQNKSINTSNLLRNKNGRANISPEEISAHLRWYSERPFRLYGNKTSRILLSWPIQLLRLEWQNFQDLVVSPNSWEYNFECQQSLEVTILVHFLQWVLWASLQPTIVNSLIAHDPIAIDISAMHLNYFGMRLTLFRLHFDWSFHPHTSACTSAPAELLLAVCLKMKEKQREKHKQQ